MLDNLFPYLKSCAQGAVAMAALAGLMTVPTAVASDHNDGPRVVDPANHAGDIVDIYAFREADQSKNPADKDRLVMVMDADGLLAPGTSKAFDHTIGYEFHLGQGAKSTVETDVITFRFNPPDADGKQAIFLSAPRIGLKNQFAGFTTKYGEQPRVNKATMGGHEVRVFAGPRDDPFFLDLQVVRCGRPCAVGGAPQPNDSFGKSNVSAIVISAPAAMLQKDPGSRVFTVWGATSR